MRLNGDMLVRRTEDMTYEAIGRRIAALREAVSKSRELGFAGGDPLSQATFARLAGIANNTLNQWEMGRGRPGLEGAIQLALRYGVTLDWIYFGDAGGLPHHWAVSLQEELAKLPEAKVRTFPERKVKRKSA